MSDGAVTAALAAWRSGDPAAEDALVRLVYADLHVRARGFLAGERREHTLQPTALVNEAYLRLLGQRSVDWQDRSHFYAIAAKTMRRVLLDHARRHLTDKRGSGLKPVPIEVAEDLVLTRPEELVALDEALAELGRFDAEAARLVELRYFAGLSVEETAGVLGCSVPTVVRRWRATRAWLFTQLERGGQRGGERGGQRGGERGGQRGGAA
jgi:RNA polymerase sigma factor (TIGR02999 family)